MRARGPTVSASLAGYLACTWDVLVPKLGNVHVQRGFADADVMDYLASAAAVAPLLDRVGELGVGQSILEAVRRSKRVAKSNTNLGIVLLLVPLAAVPEEQSLREGIAEVVARLTVVDSRLVFEAIRLAGPGGLGRVSEQDVFEEPTLPLQAVMTLAAERDLVARQYAFNYADVFERGLESLLAALEGGQSWVQAVVTCHLRLLAELGDSHVARKHGMAASRELAQRAAEILQAGWPEREAARRRFEACDAWLRQMGYNPGATADLVVATLFVAFRDDYVPLPYQGRLGMEGPL
ncbi:MAG: triphosphoribosyl-dephospho-CoA synthase [Gemmatales bacterium]|nr:triphosphoribosyl-dephospho-CoA synthase [Gemmatales bacterium]